MSLSKLIQWSKAEFNLLPWRKNRSLYRTLVSEIMLQQTTVSTVVNHYERFLTQFPDIESLAKASDEEMLIAWKGLGYYRRARNLKKIAETIAGEFQGEFPKDLETLQSIPGIGPYTANAIVGIGMDKRALAIDANLERVIARLYGINTPKGLKLQKEIKDKFLNKEIFNEKVSFRNLNEALMDLGRTFCQARKASCEICFMKNECRAFKSGKPLSLPTDLTVKTKAQEHELSLLRLFVVKDGKILVYKKEDHEWLHGQYEVPTLILATTDDKLVQYQRLTKSFNTENLLKIKTSITKYKITNFLHQIDEKKLKQFGFKPKLVWKSIDSSASNFSTATLKGIKGLKL